LELSIICCELSVIAFLFGALAANAFLGRKAAAAVSAAPFIAEFKNSLREVMSMLSFYEPKLFVRFVRKSS
jgi:hypothetical protein